jgi:membrane fusion protein (multidrug efflux system)
MAATARDLSTVPASATGAPVAEADAAPAPPSRRRLFIGVAAVLAVVGGIVFYALEHGRESTDDAQVDADVVAVPARVGGMVTKVFFVENQRVKAGEPLAELDEAPLKAKLEGAEGELKEALDQAESADADASLAERNAVSNKSAARATLAGAAVGERSSTDQLREGEAQLASARTALVQATQDRDRIRTLSQGGAASKQQLDNAENQFQIQQSNLQLAQARLDTLRTSVVAAKSRIDEASAHANAASDVSSSVKKARANAGAAHDRVAIAQSKRDLAALDLSYAKILAPQSGIVSRKSIQVGQAVVLGQAIVQLVTDGRWVTANFKETQVDKMRVGQPAKIEIDAFGSIKLRGEIESLSGGTGSRFTLLPPDNASGNFTKVVQRVPVRVKIIDAPADLPIRPGMNVELTIDTRGQK